MNKPIKRRHFFTGCVGLATASVLPRWQARQEEPIFSVTRREPSGFDPATDREQPIHVDTITDMDSRDSQTMAVPVAHIQSKVGSAALKVEPNSAKPTVNKSIDFARDYDDDIFVSEAEQHLLHSVVLRLKNLQNTIGFGNFNILSFDDALVFAKRFANLGQFTQAELAFIEKVFFTRAADYGFLGEKVTTELSTAIAKKEAYKVPHSGHYIFRGESLDYYNKLKSDVGESIILTSGIRANVKQLYLFLAKTLRVNGNLSRASRSLAPPGYSYHGIGDFDVGRVGWGAKNFSDDFAATEEFKRMRDLGYIAIRYDHGNQLGVRFEPWHIKVV